MNTHIVIMAGGIGSRFWPLSTPEYPKQFTDILGCGRTLIQLTYDRFSGIASSENIWVVTNTRYVDIVRRQLPDVPVENILAEPVARNTAPCIAWAGWKINKRDPQANIVVTPSDAIVMDVPAFRDVISEALEFTAKRPAIVTLGICPNRPETGYGYVHMDGQEHGRVYKVLEFKEKPDAETARKYLADGGYLWNAGIFVWNVRTLIDSVRDYAPQLESVMNALSSHFDTREESSKTAELFPLCEKISIDFAIMEKHPLVYTIPSSFGWSDLGNWRSLHEKLQKDNADNASVGNVRFYECSDCVVHAEDIGRVVVQGLHGYIVSEKGGQLLICKISEEQRIKEFSE